MRAGDSSLAFKLESCRSSVGAGVTVLIVLAVLIGCGARQESSPTVPPVPTYPTARVTADEVARALQQDEFFAKYRQTRLLIQGTVVSIERRGNDLIITVGSTVPTKVECDLGNRSSTAHLGDTITVLSADPGRDASRDAGMLLLRNCGIPGEGKPSAIEEHGPHLTFRTGWG